MPAPAYLGMSDEDFLKALPPDAPEAGTTTQETTPKEGTEASGSNGTENAGDGTKPQGTTEEGTETDTDGQTQTQTDGTESKGDEVDPGKEVDPKPGEVDPLVDPKAGTKEAQPTGTTQTTQTTQTKVVDDKTKEKPVEAAPDYEGFFKRVMAPFKANGKMVELKSPEEVLSLMQMGANYTKKMQEIVPHRKAILMLEKNGLLDEGKLSYLIDLDKRNPEAIKKLIKDSGIDPMEIDTSVEPSYRNTGNHRVTDEEAAFQTALDDLKSNQSGHDTLLAINTDWDHASKELLWKSPEVMQIIHQQRESGVYDRIATEMNRQKTLGILAPTTPFLQAYKTVGDQLVEAKAFDDLKPTGQVVGQGTAAVVTTRVAAPKPAVVNNDRAKAASSTRPSAQTQKPFVNPLAMSDADFLKHMADRV